MALTISLARPLGSLSRAAVRATGCRSVNINATCRRGLRTGLVSRQSVEARTWRFSLGQTPQQQQQQQQIRWKSQTSNSNTASDNELGQSDAPQLKRVGVNAALPSASPSSPTSQPRAILIDVREPAELSSTGIIPTALSIPLASQPDALFLSPEEFETRFGFPKPGVASSTASENFEVDETGETKDVQDKPVVFYCKAGVRARAAAQLALQAGYDPARVGVYDGSWVDWVDRGGRVEKWEPEE
ncbi:hypothetical protein VTN00DRAFT_7743 [Thermoascus crustaceus]|uniref:uncharacterized protein n=1 Tax=Thermoascus crustaceus TaxID=5088 RepID=UPI00374338D1